jgi:hypothetical protein
MIVIEKIEGNIVRLEIGEKFIELPISEFPKDISEGDVLTFLVDKEKTESIRKSASEKLFSLFNKKR